MSNPMHYFRSTAIVALLAFTAACAEQATQTNEEPAPAPEVAEVVEEAPVVEEQVVEVAEIVEEASASEVEGVVAEVTEVVEAEVAEVAEVVEAEVAEVVEAVGPITLSGGTWVRKAQKVDGTWAISRAASGELTISFDDDFSTRNAPDLKVFLSPLTATDVTAKTAVDGSLFIAPLSSNTGGQSYVIPAGTDLSDYKSLLIHCQQFTKLWAAAAL